MAIYHHVENKDALLQLLVRDVFSRMKIRADPRLNWRERVLAWARSYRDLLQSHSALVLQIPTDKAASLSAMALVGEPLLQALQDAGLSDAMILAAADTIVDFINGAGLALASETSGPTGTVLTVQPGSIFNRILERAVPERSSDRAFEGGIHLILEGARALNAQASEPR